MVEAMAKEIDLVERRTEAAVGALLNGSETSLAALWEDTLAKKGDDEEKLQTIKRKSEIRPTNSSRTYSK